MKLILLNKVLKTTTAATLIFLTSTADAVEQEKMTSLEESKRCCSNDLQ